MWPFHLPTARLFLSWRVKALLPELLELLRAQKGYQGRHKLALSEAWTRALGTRCLFLSVLTWANIPMTV